MSVYDFFEEQEQSQLNDLKKAKRDLCLLTHKDKTDDELHAILEHNSVAIYTLDKADAYAALGESEACNEILAKRAQLQNYKFNEELNMMFALQNWEEANVARRKKAIMNLLAATSYHGQLVTAVLEEEDGLTAEEIRNWADELAAMDDDEYKKLLDNLDKERVLFLDNDGKYYLLSLCTADLFPTNPSLWLEYHHCFGYGKFLQHMVATRKPLTERDWIEISGSYFNKRDLEENPKKAYQNVKKNYLDSYVKDGALSVTPIPDSDLNYYYFTMLGEWEGE